MSFHMRTTIVIDDELFRELKRRAAEERRTLSEVTQEALRRGLLRRPATRRPTRAKLPAFAMGKPAVDLADRNQLLDTLDRSRGSSSTRRSSPTRSIETATSTRRRRGPSRSGSRARSPGP
jgi:predicted transcriptional regulator